MRLGLRGKIILSLVATGVVLELALWLWEQSSLASEQRVPPMTAVTLAIALMVLVIFGWGSWIGKRLRKVAHAARSISESGPGIQLKEEGSDEISDISQAFNQMSASLGSSQQELQEAFALQKDLAKMTETHRSILRATISSSLDAIITIDQDGKLVEFSESAERIFGYERDEILGQELAECIIPEHYREAHRKGMARFRQSGKAVVLGQRLELTALRKGGEEFPCELAISRVEVGDEILFTAFMRDISDRHGYEAELKLAAHAFEASEAIFITDEEANIVRVNKAFTRITGYALEDVEGKNPRLLASGQHDDRFYEQMWQQIEKQGRWSGEIVNRRKNGELLPEFLTISSVSDREGQISHYVAHFTDLSEQKAVEASLRKAQKQAEAASLAKSRFLATMSHEIRTPLNAIINMNQLLAESPLTEQQEQLVKTAGEAGQTLVALLNNVLDFSRIEAGRIELAPEWVSVSEAASSLMELFDASASQKRLKLELTIAEDLPAQFYCDALRFRQILLNLIGNAVKFTEQGEVNVRLMLNDEDHLVLQVQDTGPGIEPEVQQLLFKEFFQGDDSRTRHHSGSGLGLAITRQLVELMEGEIRLESKLGHGATFEVELPLVYRHQSRDGDRNKSVHLKPQLKVVPTILLVEDSASNRAVATEVLKRQVKEIYVAENGLIAVELAAQHTFDVILMDMAMPVMDGLEATRHIRSHNGPNRDTPILAMTANAFEEDKQACLEAGMDDFISKPLDIPLLRAKVVQWAVERSVKAMPECPETEKLVQQSVPTYLQQAIVEKLAEEAGTEALHHIVTLFQQEAPERAGKLMKAVESDDFQEAQMQAHTLKSSASTLGLHCLQEQAKAMEFAAKAQSQEKLQAESQKLEETLEISLLELELCLKALVEPTKGV